MPSDLDIQKTQISFYRLEYYSHGCRSSNSSNTQQYVEFRPGDDGSQRYAQGGDILHIITPDATGAYFGISVRQLP